MSVARQFRFALQGKADVTKGKADARGLSGRMRQARQGGCASQGRADTLVKAGQILEESSGSSGKAVQFHESRPLR
jgi:hypothetical protein